MNKLIVFLFMFMETSMLVTSCSTAHQQSSSFTRPLRRVIPTRRLGMWTMWQTCNKHWGRAVCELTFLMKGQQEYME